MLDQISERLQGVLKTIRGHGKLTEANVQSALRDVRMALLEADVHYQVARDFVARVKERALGQEVLLSVSPAQQMVKIFYDELTAALGGEASALDAGRGAGILMVGLNGAGKTTSAGKLARLLRERGRRPGLVACDVRRPAAVEQLATLAADIGVPCFRPGPGEDDALRVARGARERGAREGVDVLLYDSAGRQEIDRELMDELRGLRDELRPAEVLLVCDAATGQQAVSVAAGFHEALGVTGIILTKLDGDARGGAALSMRSVTGCPIKFVGVGERMEQFEIFHPDRLAGRILGMGDVVSLVEKAAAAVDEREARQMEERMRRAEINLEDFLAQMRMMRRLGSFESILGMLPGVGAKLKEMPIDEGRIRRLEAIVLSMTPAERRRPAILDARRRRRIAAGSGTSVAEVNSLVHRFEEMRRMLKRAGDMRRRLPGMLGPQRGRRRR